MQAEKQVSGKLSLMVLSWAPVALWMTVMFLFSNNRDISTVPLAAWLFDINDPAFPQKARVFNFILKKTAHLLEYFLLGIFTARAAGGLLGTSSRRWWMLAIGFGLVFAISDEIHQKFVATRTPRALDVGIDTIGFSLALIAVWWRRGYSL